MEACEGLDIWIHVFLTLALVGGEWSASCPGCFTPSEIASSTRWIGGWVGLRTSLDDMEKILDPARTQTLTPCHPAHSQSLYQLHYPGSFMHNIVYLYVH
jgi:hypothetical protein